MRSEHQQRVDQFMRLAGQEFPTVPTMPDEKTRVLRARLILEEALETCAALGVRVEVPSEPSRFILVQHTNDLCLTPTSDTNLFEAVDGCCDVIVVTTGTLTALGVDAEAVQKIVDENNLAKFGPGGYRDEGGKWIKPPGHKPPDIETELKRQLKRQTWNSETELKRQTWNSL